MKTMMSGSTVLYCYVEGSGLQTLKSYRSYIAYFMVTLQQPFVCLNVKSREVEVSLYYSTRWNIL